MKVLLFALVCCLLLKTSFAADSCNTTVMAGATYTACAPYLQPSNSFFLWDNSTFLPQFIIDAVVTGTLAAINSMNMPFCAQCKSNLIRMVCQFAFPDCVMPGPVPALPTNGIVCSNANNICIPAIFSGFDIRVNATPYASFAPFITPVFTGVFDSIISAFIFSLGTNTTGLSGCQSLAVFEAFFYRIVPNLQ